MNSALTMARALIYLRATSLAGLIRSRLARLKQPKYLAGAIVGAAYLYFVFLRRAQGPRHAGGPATAGPGVPFPAEALPLIIGVAALVVLIIFLANWAIPRRNAALGFSETEIAFLFPAPVNRRMLIHYRLLSSQLGIVFSALILTVVFRRGQGIGGNIWFHAIGWWLILATLDLHGVGAMFTYSKLLNPSITTALRQRITLAVALAVAGALALWIWITVRAPQHDDLLGARAIWEYIANQLHAGPLPWLLAIPRAVVGPYFALDLREFILALGPALLVLAAHYYWVVHTEVSFEEASIARAEKRARLRARRGDWRSATAFKAQRPPFELARAPRVEFAFLWKNLLATGGFFRPRPVLYLVLCIVIGTQWLARNPHFEATRTVTGLICAGLIVMTVLLGPIMNRRDLRADLSNADMLKTYPLRGWQVMFGELLTPIAILSVLVWLLLLSSYLLLPTQSLHWLTPALRGLVALGVAALAPPFIAIQLLVLNAATLIFPAWTQQLGSPTERGFDVLGQRIIFMASQLLVTLLTTLPALILAALILVVGQWLIGFTVAAVLAIAGMCLLLAWEAWLGLRWLGTRFEEFDLATDLRP